jgi:Protein of unknown function (DUF2783)
MPLIRTPHIADPDGFYEELVKAQRDLPDEQAQKMIAKLALLLANHVGDRQVLSEAIRLAAASATAQATDRTAAETNANTTATETPKPAVR